MIKSRCHTTSATPNQVSFSVQRERELFSKDDASDFAECRSYILFLRPRPELTLNTRVHDQSIMIKVHSIHVTKIKTHDAEN